MKSVSELKVQVFADGADKASMLELYRQSYIKGFTTNPTLMRKAGITDYERFALEILQQIPDRPISFEVFADDENEMERQARRIAQWGGNVYVKIPVTNTRQEPMYKLIRRLSAEGVQINATALLALDQVRDVAQALRGGAPSYISVFAGRVADTGRDPVPSHEVRARDNGAGAEHATGLGEPKRAAEHFPGRRNRLPHHYRDFRRSQENQSDRQRPARIFFGDGADVP